MENEPFVIERTFNSDIEKVWQAITDKEQMKQWYFDIADFKPEIGCEFRFTGGNEDRVYLHLCRIIEIVKFNKLKYSWRYDGYDGISFVSFELFPEGEKTRLKLTHEGLETFPQNIPDFARKNFEEGWTYIIGKSLPGFLQNE